MKLIKCKEENGDIRMFNPHYVKEVKMVKSDLNDDFCIALILDRPMSESNVYTMLFHNEEEATRKLNYVRECMESI